MGWTENTTASATEKDTLLGGIEDIDTSSPSTSPELYQTDSDNGEKSSNQEAEKDEKKKKKERTSFRLRTLDYGIWRVFYEEKQWSFIPGPDFVKRIKDTLEILPYIWMFTKEVWAIAPGHLLLWALLSLWDPIDMAVSLWVSTTVLDTIQAIIIKGEVDMEAVWFAFMVKILYSGSQFLRNRLDKHNRRVLKQRVEKHCGVKLLNVYTQMDLVTLQSKEFTSKWERMSNQFVGDAVWGNFDDSVKTLMVFIEIPSKALLLKNLLKDQKNGWFLASICVLPQILKGLLFTDILSGSWFAYSFNKNYVRLVAVGSAVARNWLFDEIITSGVGKYLQKEYHKAVDSLANTSRQEIHSINWENYDLQSLFERWLADIPLMYSLITAAHDPKSFSLTSLTVTRDSTASLLYTVKSIFSNPEFFSKRFRFIKDYYLFLETMPAVVDGYLPYPTPANIESQGMKIEFKNVSLKYPETSTYALKDVSFVIPAGATVVFVGANGSGKTTTVSLLSRLMDATSGEILIDDIPLKQYQIQTIREAQAILRQSYQHFPFSLRENIGMGDPACLEDTDEARRTERILRAAELGGVDQILKDIREKQERDVEDEANRPDLYRNLTINGKAENLESFFPSPYGHKSKQDIKARIEMKNKKGNESESTTPANGNLSLGSSEKSSQKDSDSDSGSSFGTISQSQSGSKLELVSNSILESKSSKSTPIDPSELDVMVYPMWTWTSCYDQTELMDLSEELSADVEKGISSLSGGQWQRLALARLFMRAGSGKVRLICADEPSAALDPRAEFEVFQRLRTLEGKKTTKLFITHRFGHVTKHADLIICMKNSEVLEMGNHEQLMKANGEYATLYNIQAQAFT